MRLVVTRVRGRLFDARLLEGAVVDHTAFIYVIDPEGRLRELLPFGTRADDIVNDVRLLLRK